MALTYSVLVALVWVIWLGGKEAPGDLRGWATNSLLHYLPPVFAIWDFWNEKTTPRPWCHRGFLYAHALLVAIGLKLIGHFFLGYNMYWFLDNDNVLYLALVAIMFACIESGIRKLHGWKVQTKAKFY